jgi:hypothetical protein
MLLKAKITIRRLNQSFDRFLYWLQEQFDVPSENLSISAHTLFRYSGIHTLNSCVNDRISHSVVTNPLQFFQEYAPSGFDVFNAIRKVDESHRGSGDLHMLGSVFCFPTGAFLWNVTTPMEVTIRSLSHVLVCTNTFNV